MSRSTVWKFRKFSLTLFWQKFRESNGLTKWITKELISRNFFRWERISEISTLRAGNFGNFPPLQIFFVKLIYSITDLYEKLIWRNFCKISWGKICKFPHSELHNVWKLCTEVHSHTLYFISKNFVKVSVLRNY